MKKYVCALLLPFLFSPLASGQDGGEIKKLLDLKDYVAKVKDSVTNHQPMPVPPETNWGVSEVSQRLDAIDKYVVGVKTPPELHFPTSINMDQHTTTTLASWITQLNDNLANLRQGSTDLNAINSDLVTLQSVETQLENSLDDLLRSDGGSALDSVADGSVFIAYHQLDQDVRPKIASVLDHVKAKSKDFSVALASQQKYDAVWIPKYEAAIEHYPQMTADLRNAVRAASRSVNGVPSEADRQAMQRAGLLTAPSVGSTVSGTVTGMLFCSSGCR